MLLGVDIQALTDDQKITVCILVRKIKAFTDHLHLAVLHSVTDTTELAMAIKEPEQALIRQKILSDVLDTLPRLSDQLRRDEVDLRRLEAVHERVVNLPRQAMITQVEDALLDVAPGLNRTQLARKTTGLVPKVDTTGYQQRCEKARAERRVEFKPLPDGMAQVKAVLPAVQAREIFQTCTHDARSLPTDERTTDQKRADSLTDRFLGYGIHRTVQVHVTIPLETLMGLTEDPALLDGYGYLSADAARELATHGPWRGILLDPYRHAEALSTDRYRPDTALREFRTVANGGQCTAPGCTTPIQELDHVIPWPAGHTTATGLTGLCTWHHHRNHDNYTVTLGPDGTTDWATPQGRHYQTTPYEY